MRLTGPHPESIEVRRFLASEQAIQGDDRKTKGQVFARARQDLLDGTTPNGDGLSIQEFLLAYTSTIRPAINSLLDIDPSSNTSETGDKIDS